MAHTPGPWTTKQALKPSDGGYDFGIGVEIDGHLHCIAEAFEVIGPTTRVDAYANAHLIAAAPDLLAALERAVTYVELTYDEEGGEEAAEAKHDLDMCNAALRKARGA